MNSCTDFSQSVSASKDWVKDTGEENELRVLGGTPAADLQ